MHFYVRNFRLRMLKKFLTVFTLFVKSYQQSFDTQLRFALLRIVENLYVAEWLRLSKFYLKKSNPP